MNKNGNGVSTTAGRLHNFSHDNVYDQELYNSICSALHLHDHIERMEAIYDEVLEKRNAVNSDSRSDDLKFAAQSAKDHYRQQVELEVIVRVLDRKMCDFAQFLYDKLSNYYSLEQLEELDRFLGEIGITRDQILNKHKSPGKRHLQLVK